MEAQPSEVDCVVENGKDERSSNEGNFLPRAFVRVSSPLNSFMYFFANSDTEDASENDGARVDEETKEL